MLKEFLFDLLQLPSLENEKSKEETLRYEKEMQQFNQQILKQRLEELRKEKAQPQAQTQTTREHVPTSESKGEHKQNLSVNKNGRASEIVKNGSDDIVDLSVQLQDGFEKAEHGRKISLSKADLRRSVLTAEILGKPLSQRRGLK